MIELLVLRSKTNLCSSEALPIGQLSEGHTKKLVEAAEGFDLVISFIGLNATVENFQWHVFHHLSENELACKHDLPHRFRKIPKV